MTKKQTPKFDYKKALAGREAVANACRNMWFVHHPAGWQHIEVTAMHGRVDWAMRTVTCPQPRTRRSLYVYLYLVSLIEFRDHDARGRAVMAKRRTRELMLGNGFSVPREMVSGAVHQHYRIDARQRRSG